MPALLLTFKDGQTRDQFLKLLQEMADAMISSQQDDGYPTRRDNGELLRTTLRTIRLDPPLKADHERTVVLYVTGQKMTEGNLPDMRKRFQQEVDSHSGNVELREFREGGWTTIQARRLQRP